MDNRNKWIIALLTFFLPFLTGCAAGDGNDEGFTMANEAAEIGNWGQGIYDGEWTVNKQVVDTARLVVTSKLSVRLPEEYLTSLCFQDDASKNSIKESPKNSNMDGDAVAKPQGLPTDIRFSVQGYSEVAQFSSFSSSVVSSDYETYYISGSYYVMIGSTLCCIDMLSMENGNIIYRADTGLWTIAITVSGFRITRLDTGEQTESKLPAPVTLYYNAKEKKG